MRLREADRGKKGPLDGRTLGMIGTWVQVEGSKGGANGRGKAGIGSRKELLWAARQWMEAQTSGGGRRAGEPSRWTVALRLG